MFKYLIIKAVSHGKMFPISVAGELTDSAVSFRGTSNLLEFPSKKYNAAGVTTTTPKSEQFIFMDSMYNAKYDVGVLRSAFNMDKATFMGQLQLVDDWTTFDNERFSEIRRNSTQLEEVTAEELALMKDVKAILVDSEWSVSYTHLTLPTKRIV